MENGNTFWSRVSDKMFVLPIMIHDNQHITYILEVKFLNERLMLRIKSRKNNS